MSSPSLCCALPNFTFPPSEQDYFAAVPPSKQQQHATHNSFNDSISLLASDATYCDTSFKRQARNDSIVLTDTLVDEPAGRKNVMNLKLALPRRLGFQQLLSATSERSTASYQPEERAVLATESFFDFNRPENPATHRPLRSIPVVAALGTENTSKNPPTFIPPSLTKQLTLPALGMTHDLVLNAVKSEQMRRLNAPPPAPAPLCFLASIDALSPSIKHVDAIEVAQNKDSLEALFVDIRPFADYIKLHIRGAINVCLPLTLLKRSNFSLHRCINSLPPHEKAVFQKYLSGAPGGRLPPIFVYDSHQNSHNLLHMCKKFIDNSCWDASNAPDIILANNSFNELQAALPGHMDAGTNEQELLLRPETELLPPPLPPPAFPPPKAAPLLSEKLRLSSLSDVLRFASSFHETSTPILSNFKLPQIAKKFEIRHNQEVIGTDTSVDESFQLFNYNPANLPLLPQWIIAPVKKNALICDEFNRLESFERLRINNALSLKRVNSAPQNDMLFLPGGTTKERQPSVSFGMDFGHKNRYKDIFLYDHSRVKLNDYSRQQCDYINASYLDPMESLSQLLVEHRQDSLIGNHVSYIAAQGPLNETIGDFWKCIINHNTPLIISLTEEFENGVNKCLPFWIPGTYTSNYNRITVELDQPTKSGVANGNIIIRSFKLVLETSGFAPVVHRVLQVQLLSWPDMSSVMDPRDLINIIVLKNHILNKVASSAEDVPRTLIHCLAGCGRTGTLCTLDTIVNVMKSNGLGKLAFNPIYQIVNSFRNQRISMVQTLRQYYLIYDTVLLYLNSTNDAFDDLVGLDIVLKFVERTHG